MLDLKPYFDAVMETDAEVQKIANQIDEHFRTGTEEGKLEALALRPALDEAQNKHAEAVDLYEAMQKTTRPNDIAKNFIPVSETSAEDAVDVQPTVIKRSIYDAMSPIDKANFIKSGGELED